MGLALALCTSAALAAPAGTSPLQSPYIREVEFYRQQSLQLVALGSLLAAQRQGLLDSQRNAVDLLLGQLYREYGLPGQATDSLQRASGTGVGSLRGMAWWELAQQRYQRGDYQRASDALARSTGLLPYELEQQRPLLQAQILIGMNRNAEAAVQLGGWQPIQQLEPYSRYNVGVALVRSGDLLKGAGMLDSVGTMAAPESELQALRDQANLAMGYGFLRADHGATARPLFKRVQLEGPFSSLALLGAGWAELAPDGTRQQNLYLSPVGCVEDPTRVLPESLMVLRRPARGACDRERTFKSRVFFEQAPGAGSEAERYRRALIPWQILIRRSPADPAVQEALLAVPYAYSRLKGREQAIEHYRSAISHYEAERRHLQRVTEMIRETPLPNVPVSMGNAPLPTWDLPRAEDLMSLGAVFASNPFQSTLRALQTLRGFTRTLAPLYARLDSMASRLGSGPAPVSETTIGEDRHSDGRTVSAHAMSDSAQDAPKAETDPDRRITYFGVFDFLPPTEIPSDPPSHPVKPAPMPDIDTDRPLAPPPARRQSRDKDDEMPLQRHAQLRRRLDKLQAQSLTTQDALEKALREMALVEIAQQQVRLDTYLAQARFSLARLLDPAVASHPGD